MSISVIIPVYNTVDFLDEGLRSVERQTFKNWECILVDDGSTDGSGQICDDWVAKDSRFKVIHQANAGVSAARNKGIEKATGEYVAFIDSDDTVSYSYLEALHSALETTSAGLSICGMEIRQEKGKACRVLPKEGVVSLSEADADKFVCLEVSGLLFSSFCKLYRRSLIEGYHIRFDPALSYGEDLLFNYEYFRHLGIISCIPEALYFYQKRRGSLSELFDKDRFNTDYHQWHVLYNFHKESGVLTEFAQKWLYRRLWGIVYDGIFRYPHVKGTTREYLYEILSIPEIAALKVFSSEFNCSGWIKNAIIHSQAWPFAIYFKIRSKI